MVEAHRVGDPELSVYQFQLACTILRCVGQIFGTYLAHSMNNLPPLNGAPEVHPLHSIINGAGVKLESGIFGAPIDWFKDPTCGDPQVKFIPLLN